MHKLPLNVVLSLHTPNTSALVSLVDEESQFEYDESYGYAPSKLDLSDFCEKKYNPIEIQRQIVKVVYGNIAIFCAWLQNGARWTYLHILKFCLYFFVLIAYLSINNNNS